MSVIAGQRIESSLSQPPTKPGLWGSLGAAVDTAASDRAGVWHGLKRRLQANESHSSSEIWSVLGERVDPTQYRPCAITDVAEEQVTEDGVALTVIRSPRGNYVRLTPPQRVLWHQMDGTRTVGQLATLAFLQFKQLLLVGDFVAALKHEGFLTESPVGVYRSLGAQLEARTTEGWGRKVLRFLAGQRWQLHNIDHVYGALYRVFGRVLFTPFFAGLWMLVAVAGAAIFLLLLTSAQASRTGGPALPFEIVTLWVALLISFLLHESAHALAVKHYRRTLRGGGVMLYFGVPAFFVDTSDIWRSPRRARILVSAAGPMSDLFVGGLAAALAYADPSSPVAPVAYKLAFTCYIATLFNLNPLLELDGYFILLDWLRLPDLRRRALAFIRGPLWQKFQWTTNQQRRTIAVSPFSREERVFTLYGALTLLYSVIAIGFAFQFWEKWLWGTIRSLWDTHNLINQVVATLLFVLVAVPLVGALAFVLIGLVRTSVAWLIRRGYGRRPGLVAVLSAGLALVLALVVGRESELLVAKLLPVLLWAVAAAALYAIRPDYHGSAIAPALNALLITTALAGVASLLRVLIHNQGIWQAADGLALLFLLLAGFAALLDVNLRSAAPREQLFTSLLMMGSFLVGGYVLLQQLSEAAAQTPLSPIRLAEIGPINLLIAAPAAFGALSLALFLPYLLSLYDSRLIWSWVLLWFAALAQTTAYVVDLRTPSQGLDVLAAGVWAAAWLVHLATIKQMVFVEQMWQNKANLNERERLVRAFQLCYAGCYTQLLNVYGTRRTRELDDRIDVIAATTNWDVRLDRENAQVGATLAARPLDVQGACYAEVLRSTVGIIEDIAGATFARRAIQAAYDALPWQERETASRLCFPDTPWARELSSAFGDVQTARLRLLRQVDILLHCDDDELGALVHTLQEHRARTGELLLRPGETAPGIWIIEAGEVLIKRSDGAIDELHRGATIGAQELLANQPAVASYRASIDSSLLFIPAAQYQALIQNAAPHAAEGLEAVETLRLLERVPLFERLPRNTLRGLTHIATTRVFESRQVIVREGVASGVFYVIKKGRAGVLKRGSSPTSTLQNDAPAKPRVALVAQLGPDEFFGELELLRGTAPLASVVALTKVETLALPHAAIQALLIGENEIAKSLEQVGSGRMIALRHAAAEPALPHS